MHPDSERKRAMLLKATKKKCCEEENQNLVEVKLSNRTHRERCLEANSIVTHDFCLWSTVFPDSQFHPHHHHKRSCWYSGVLLCHRKAEKQTLILPWHLFIPLALPKVQLRNCADNICLFSHSVST